MAECQRCQFQKVVQSLTELVKTYPRREAVGGKTVVTDLNRAQLTYREANDKKVKKAAKAIIEPYSRMVEFINEELLPLARDICLFCSASSDDDNLTSRGRSVLSLDAMPTGISVSNDTDTPNEGSWLNKNVKRLPPPSHGVTNLPTHIEDMLRKVLHDFAELDVFEQNMIFHQMTGATMVDFATMKWVPHEMKRAQSKEFADYRWKRLVTRFPLAAALRKARPLAGAKSRKPSNGDAIPLVQDELKFPMDFGI